VVVAAAGSAAADSAAAVLVVAVSAVSAAVSVAAVFGADSRAFPPRRRDEIRSNDVVGTDATLKEPA